MRVCSEEAALARELGFDAEYVDAVPLVGRPGVRFANQARIHPRRYLAGVAKAFVALGGRIHEHSAVDEFCDDPRAREGQRPHGDVRGRRHRHAQSAGRPRRDRRRHALSDQARALHELCDRRACRRAASCPTRSGGTPPIRITTFASSRTGTTTCVIFGGEDHKTGQEEDTSGLLSRGSKTASAHSSPRSS